MPLTVIREPINQFFSHANHILTEDVGDGILSRIQDKLKTSVGHFLDHATHDELDFFDCPQSKTIFSGTIDWRAIRLTDRVEWLLQQYAAVFTTETMEAELAFILKPREALFPRENVKNYKRQSLTGRQLDTLSDLLQEDRLLHDLLTKGPTSLGYTSQLNNETRRHARTLYTRATSTEDPSERHVMNLTEPSSENFPAPAETTLEMSGSVILVRDTQNFRLTYYQVSTQILVLVFISGGRLAPGASLEEFKRSLESHCVSIIFIADLNAHWFNYDETPEMWLQIDEIAKTYNKVVTIGESMGGSGAILANMELTRVNRTLAFSPQYSIFKPFIDFDVRYETVSRGIQNHRYIHFADAPDPEKCVLLFGNTEWKDYIHSAMYAGHGFRPLYVKDAGHNVAKFLKDLPGNGLVKLVGALLDWTTPFDQDRVRSIFPDVLTTSGMKAGASFASEATSHNHTLLSQLAAKFFKDTGLALSENVAFGKKATQSSVSKWSHGSTPELDAAGAVTGQIGSGYSFHTDLEERPWWSVDLGTSHHIQEVRLFNFLSNSSVMERSAMLSISFSSDGVNWISNYVRENPASFGGADGFPLIMRPPEPARTRYIKIQLMTQTFLHLNQVQVFAYPES